jgi:ATP-dependent Lon protease
MPETSTKLGDVRQLAIFPLPLVLLPNEFLPLHIFEDRYREMLVAVGGKGGTFGVNLYDQESALGERPEPGSVGCAAEIRELKTLDDGRSNIVTLGTMRYRIIDYVDAGTQFYSADVAFFGDEHDDDTSREEGLADDVFATFQRIAEAAFKMSGSRGRLPDITRGSPEQLSFLVGAAFNFDNELKYELLKITSTAERLERIQGLLSQMVGQMEESAQIHERSKTNGHSKKKLDL